MKYSRSTIDLQMKALEIAQKLRITVPKDTTTSNEGFQRGSTSNNTCNNITFSSNDHGEAQASVAEKQSNKGVELNDVKPLGPVVNPSELRIFVKNLHPQTSEARIKAYFSRWGEVSDVCIREPEHKYGEGANMAFVTFTFFHKDSPIKTPIHVIDSRSVTVHIVGTKPNVRHPTVTKSSSIMVTGAIHRASEQDIKQTFSKFGKIVKIFRKPDPKIRQQFLRYCFIEFANSSIVDKIIDHGQSIKVSEQVVDVRRAKGAF